MSDEPAEPTEASEDPSALVHQPRGLAHEGAAVSTESSATRQSMRTIFIDGKPYQFRSIRQCRVCQSEDREAIERGLMLQHGYRIIVESLHEDSDLWFDKHGNRIDLDVAIRRVQTHSLRGHSNIDAAIQRAIMEAHAKRAGIDLAGVEQTIITDMGVISEVRRLGFESIVKDGKKPTINQTLKAAELGLQYQEIAGESSSQVFQTGIEAVMRVLAKNLPPETMQWVIADLEADADVTAAFKAAYDAMALQG